jgi:hypothetical protein
MDRAKEQKETVFARQDAQKEAILAQLRRMPIIAAVCEKSGLSRATFYRMRDTDEQFKAAVADAVEEGVAFVTDMSETQLIQLIKDKNFASIQLWLRHHHPKYANKLEVKAAVKHSMETLTPEKEALVERGLKFMARPPAEAAKVETKDKDTK